jgi:hypothetical protein
MIDTRTVTRQIEVKDVEVVFICDACGTERTGDLHPEVRPTAPAGWLTVTEASDKTSVIWPSSKDWKHICSYACLLTFAADKARSKGL